MNRRIAGWITHLVGAGLVIASIIIVLTVKDTFWTPVAIAVAGLASNHLGFKLRKL